MYFDRFDICEAHFLFCYLFHEGQGSATYAKFAQLERLGFRCAPSIRDPKDLNENAREIFRQLVVRRYGIRSTHAATSEK